MCSFANVEMFSPQNKSNWNPLAKEKSPVQLILSQMRSLNPCTPQRFSDLKPLHHCNTQSLSSVLHTLARELTKKPKIILGRHSTKIVGAEGQEYLVYSLERQTKIRTGMNPRPTKPRAYTTPECPEKDPVALYTQYQERRPADMRVDDVPFFLTINYNHKPNHPWYKHTPIGTVNCYK